VKAQNYPMPGLLMKRGANAHPDLPQMTPLIYYADVGTYHMHPGPYLEILSPLVKKLALREIAMY